MTISLLESVRKVTGKEPTISYFASIGVSTTWARGWARRPSSSAPTAGTITATNTSCWTPSTRPPRPFYDFLEKTLLP